MSDYIWSFLGYKEDEPNISDKYKRLRDLLLRQIRESKLKLKPVVKPLKITQLKPSRYKRRKDKKKAEKKAEARANARARGEEIKKIENIIESEYERICLN